MNSLVTNWTQIA